ncbi:hypothetical protein FACS1894179_06040 [Bacteroidia bacterium]|nr:hypothetical protein FACS1894179_06040 [Bacteroidia bacterium]
MDDTNKSTKEEPLKYFQWMFLENGLNSRRDEFFTQFDEYGFISKDEDNISYYADVYDENTGNIINDAIHKKNFSQELTWSLIIQCKHTLKLIDSAIANISFQDNDPARFLNLQINILHEIQINSNKYTEKYPFITDFLNNIFIYIEKKQHFLQPVSNISNTNVKEIKQAVDDSIDTSTNKSIIEFTPTQQLVLEIFGYFKDRMNSKQEYDRLIECVASFVDTGIIPDNSFRKFSHIYSIKNEEIRYTFHILYNKNKKKIDRKQLCSFIISIFEDFSDVSQKYVYSKLSTPPDEFSPYIPDFIRKFKD